MTDLRATTTADSRSPTDADRSAAMITRARAAQAGWETLGPRDRATHLRGLPAAIGDHIDQIADLIHNENGKPRAEAVAHEAVAAVQLARHHLEAAPRVLAGETVSLPYLPHRRAARHRRAFGVVVAIAPWNIPFLIPLSQVLPALLAGNAVILKPSELASATAELLAELLNGCGLPDGLLQVALGGDAVGQALIESGPDKVVFTGSVATGRSVMAACARYPIPVSLELGGVDAMIVRADADLEFTASAATWGATFNGGQACCSIERLLVHRSIHDALVERISDKMRRIDNRHDLGPAINERQFDTWTRHLDDARSRCLDIRCGGHRLAHRRLEPTLIAGTGVTAAAVWREESFGPLVATVPFDSDDDAIRIHNDTRFGLTASIFTADVQRGASMAARLRAGAVAVNEVAATLYSAPELPWGGVGDSGFGRSHGDDALLDATWSQVIDEPRGVVFGPKRPWWYPYGEELEATMSALGRAFAASRPLPRITGLARAGAGLLPMLSRSPKL